MTAIATANEIGYRHIPMPLANRPESRHGKEGKRKRQRSVGQCEKPRRTGSIDEARHGNHGVRGEQISAEQEPGDEGPKTASGETPLFESMQVSTFPATRKASNSGHASQQQQKDRG